MGRRDPAVQRERGLASGRARRERLQPRNARIVEMHHAGWSIAHVARQEGLSWVQTWRVVTEDRSKPGVFHQPIAPLALQGEISGKIAGNDEIRNGRAAISSDESQLQQPQNQLNQSIKTPQSDEITQFDGPLPTPFVDNSVENVDNLASPWDEAIREGERRRADEFRRPAEREQQAWRERGPPDQE